MEKHISATQAARAFSDLLNKVKFQGDRYVIESGGKPADKILSDISQLLIHLVETNTERVLAANVHQRIRRGIDQDFKE